MEKILCSAIMFKGRIPFCGYRHIDILKNMELFLDKKWDYKEIEDDISNRGFLTSLNRFVNRTEGYKIAKTAGQLRIIHDDTPILTSEDLY